MYVANEGLIRNVVWRCKTSGRDCVVVKSEGRCICGHRLKQHSSSDSGATFVCKSANCRCSGFHYHVAAGAWSIRCRCKHRHTEHEGDQHPFRCLKEGCSCASFESPFVCNCGETWAAHHTVIEWLAPLVASEKLTVCSSDVQTLGDVKRWTSSH